MWRAGGRGLPETIRRVDGVVAAITIASAPLFLWGLGATYLWQDEAQTALLGRSVLEHGVPRVGDGPESLSAHLGEEKGLASWFVHIPWLQAYLTAASFALFGESAWSARLPFALFGWMCVPAVAWVTRKAGAGRWAARGAAALVAANVPFLVLSRNARYYAPAALLTLLAVGAYAGSLRTTAARAPRDRVAESPAPAALLASLSLLVLTFDLAAAGVLAALALHRLVVTGTEEGLRDSRFWIPWCGAAVLLCGWVLLGTTAPSRSGVSGLLSGLGYKAVYYLGQLDVHVLPLPYLLTLAPLLKPDAVSGDPGRRRAAGLLLAVAAGAVVGAMIAPRYFLRYVTPAIVVLLAVAAIGLEAVARRGRAGKALAVALFLPLLLTNLPHRLSHEVLGATAERLGVRSRDGYRPPPAGVPLTDLLGELRDPPAGPVAAVVEFLREHAQPGEILTTTYGDLPLKFHTELEVYGGPTGQLPPPDRSPDWLWPRHLPALWRAVRPAARWIGEELQRTGYERVVLPVPDRPWENREDPDLHVFQGTGPPAPPVELYRRSRSGAGGLEERQARRQATYWAWVLERGDPERRREAMVALSKLGHAAVPALLEALRQGDSATDREAAATALAELGAVGVPALMEGVNDPAPSVQVAVARALGEIGAPAVPALIEFIQIGSTPSRSRGGMEPRVLEEAVRVLARTGPEAIPVLLSYSDDSLDFVARTAAESIVAAGPENIPLLITLLRGSDARIAMLAARVLGRFGSRAAEAVPDLERLAAAEQGELRAAASRALERIGRGDGR